MIGFIDYDFFQTSKLSYPNLEMMKLSSFLTFDSGAREFCRLLSPDEPNLEAYEEIHFFAEGRDCVIPNAVRTHPNTHYHGLYFTDGGYKPFERELIEYTIPRPYIYIEYLKKRLAENLDNQKEVHALKKFVNSAYYRACVNGKILPIPAFKKNERLYLYDNNFFFNGWEAVIDEITSRSPSSIICVRPIHCKTMEQYLKIREHEKIARGNEVWWDLPVPLTDINYLFNHYYAELKNDIIPSAQVYLPIGGNSLVMDSYCVRELAYKLNLLYSFWARSIPLKLRYVRPTVGHRNVMEELFEELEKWSSPSTPYRRDTAFIDFVAKKNKAVWSAIERCGEDKQVLFRQSYKNISNHKIWRLT